MFFSVASFFFDFFEFYFQTAKELQLIKDDFFFKKILFPIIRFLAARNQERPDLQKNSTWLK
jgi:hypothetical protein